MPQLNEKNQPVDSLNDAKAPNLSSRRERIEADICGERVY